MSMRIRNNCIQFKKVYGLRISRTENKNAEELGGLLFCKLTQYCVHGCDIPLLISNINLQAKHMLKALVTIFHIDLFFL